MRIVLFSVALALSGCANVAELRAQAPYQSDFNICRAMVMGQGPVRGVAMDEAGRRQLDCTPHLATIQAMQAQQANDTATTMMLLQASQPKVPPMAPLPSSTICTSRMGPGGTVTTVCP